MTTPVYRIVPSPIGPLTLIGRRRERGDGSRGGAVLAAIWFSSGKADRSLDPDRAPADPPADAAPDDGALDDAASQLREYFSGTRREFDLELDPEGTPFQKRVWQELTQIPWGQTLSYRDLAERIGNPGAVRAVGGANGRNPIPIVVPCHRVIGSDGTLTGFGGGVPAKEFLLGLEGARIGSQQSLPGTDSPGSAANRTGSSRT